MQFGVDVSTITQTFTSAVPACVTYPGDPGVSLGGGRKAHYRITKLSIDPPLPSGVQPPVAWRPNKPASDTTQTQVDLALFTRNPNVTNSAAERSTELTNQMLSIWGDTCGRIAPAACVFWAFCGQRLGPSPNAWKLTGIVTPDPPNTVRTSPVPTGLQVEQPELSAADAQLLKLGLPIAGKGLYPAQIIGPDVKNSQQRVSFATAPPNRTCQRALELPELLSLRFTTGLNKEIKTGGDEIAKKIAELTSASRWVRFDTGASNRVRLLLGVSQNLVKENGLADIKIRERDSLNKLIAETGLPALSPVTITAFTQLPATWNTPTSPWYADVTSILPFLVQDHLVPIFVELKPNPATTKIEVAYTGAAAYRPSVVVGAIESCPKSETDREENGVIIQQSTIQQIQSYLDGGSPVPLLEPNTDYTITVDYDVVVTEADGSTPPAFGPATQAFSFHTSGDVPKQLDPWVLCTSPAQSETFAFYKDDVDIMFNDRTVIQLFNKLGYQLTMDLRAADGLPEPANAPVTTTSISGVGTAAYDSLQELVKEGKLPCVGATSDYQNQQFKAPVELRPLMGYTLDLKTDPALPAPSDPSAPVTPLFRRQFTTGRYASPQSLADDLGATLITHRALTQKLSFPVTPGRTIQADQDIQNAFLTAGEHALPSPDKNAIVMYWVPSSPGGPYVPHAILIDSVEPVWRTRQEPTFTTPIPSDPTFKIVTIGPATSLEIQEAGGSSIGGYITSPSGARTVAMFAAGFSPPPGGTTVTLTLHRPASATYNTADESHTVFALPVAPQAPWENDHV